MRYIYEYLRVLNSPSFYRLLLSDGVDHKDDRAVFRRFRVHLRPLIARIFPVPTVVQIGDYRAFSVFVDNQFSVHLHRVRNGQTKPIRKSDNELPFFFYFPVATVILRIMIERPVAIGHRLRMFTRIVNDALHMTRVSYRSFFIAYSART